MYVKVEGTKNVLRALGMLDPDLAKEIGKELSDVGRKIGSDARALVPTQPPLSGWGVTGTSNPRRNALGNTTRGGQGWPAWTGQKYASSIRSSRRQTNLTVKSTATAAASIFEVAGSVTNGRTAAGRAFVRNLQARYPVSRTTRGRLRSRAMIRSMQINYVPARASLTKAVERAANELQRRIG